MSLHFPLIVSLTPTTYIHDVDDVKGPDGPLSDQSDFDSDLEDRKVTPVFGSIELFLNLFLNLQTPSRV